MKYKTESWKCESLMKINVLDEKCVKVMQTSKNGKSPSTDGLPIEL
jgi:hypothetical protein